MSKQTEKHETPAGTDKVDQSELIEALEFGCPFKPGSIGIKDAEAAERIMQQAADRIRVLSEAISWALGEGNSDFGDHMPENAPRYWWRKELSLRGQLSRYQGGG